MAIRFKRVFGLYTFFSVFLPGVMFLLGVAPVIEYVYVYLTTNSLAAKVANSYFVTLLGTIVFVTLGLFVGFILHSLGALFEKKVGGSRLFPEALEDWVWFDFDWLAVRFGRQHRELFHEMLNGQYRPTHADLVSAAIETVNDQFPRLTLDPEAPQDYSETEQTDRQSEIGSANPPEDRIRDEETNGETEAEGPSDDELETEDPNSSGEDGPSRVGLGDVASSVDEFVRRLGLRIKQDESESPPDADDGEESEPADGDPDPPNSKKQSDAMYAIVRSRVHMDKTGRSRTFHAVIASCRSMLIAWFALTILYGAFFGGIYLVQLDVPADVFALSELLEQLTAWLWSPGSKSASISNFTITFLTVVITGFVGVYGLATVVRANKRYYLEYLLTDYLLLHRESGGDDLTSRDGRDGPPTGRR